MKSQRSTEEEFFPAEESMRSRTSSKDSRQRISMGGGDQTSKFEEPQFEDAQSSYQSPSEIDFEKDGTLSKSGKKVSFAEADQKFHLKPEPEVKHIPGTKLFSFAPSSTHEQPPDSKDSMPIPKAVKNSEEAAKDFFDQPAKAAEVSETEMSTSPKAFLKAMTKG